MYLFLIFVILCILFYMNFIKPHFTWKERGLVHRTPWPIVGNMGRSTLRLTSLPENVMEIYKEFQNEQYFGFYQFLQPVIVLRDIETIKQITIKDFDNFTDHNSFIDENSEPLFGRNLFSLKGDQWRNMRSILSPAFTSSKMRSMYVLMSEVADQFVEHFLAEAKKEPNGKPVTVEMKDVLTRYANDVIATTAFGIKTDSLKQKENDFYMYGKEATNFTGFRALKFFGYTVSPVMMKLFRLKVFSDDVCNFFRNLVSTTMETREREGIIRPDMIHLLMEAKKGKLKHEAGKQDEGAGFATVEESNLGKETNKQAYELTLDDITAQVVLFFFAGFDSISNTMCHMAHEIAIHPDIQKRLQEEIDNAYEENNGKMSYETVLKLKYLDLVVCETLRKWPAGIFTDRRCINSYTLPPKNPGDKPFRIYKGDLIWLPIFNLHRDPNYFPDPEKFDPERFSDENKDNIQPFSYLPFGAGPRNCIGSRFALLEMKTVFVNLLKKFDLVVVEKTQIPLKLNKTSFNLLAEKGFWLGFQPRDKVINK